MNSITLLLPQMNEDLNKLVSQVRRDILRMVHAVNSGHPGGSLGRKLLYTVEDLMIADNLPFICQSEKVSQALMKMTSSRLGLCLIQDEQENLKGIFTDGDLRRGLSEYPDLLEKNIDEIMSANPITVSPSTSLIDAQKLLLEHKIKALVIEDPANKKVLGVYDLFLSNLKDC